MVTLPMSSSDPNPQNDLFLLHLGPLCISGTSEARHFKFTLTQYQQTNLKTNHNPK